MKYKYGNFFQMSNEFFDDDYLAEISTSAALMYVHLCHLENKYTGSKTRTFRHTDEQLSNELHMSLNTIQKCKRELVRTGLISVEKVRPERVDDSKKKTTFPVTEYTLHL